VVFVLQFLPCLCTIIPTGMSSIKTWFSYLGSPWLLIAICLICFAICRTLTLTYSSAQVDASYAGQLSIVRNSVLFEALLLFYVNVDTTQAL
jgi:hypothetical protein